jgi:hypothetical protein
MKHNSIPRERDRIVRCLRNPQQILRGSLLQRTIHHKQHCPKCARGEGHAVAVLTTAYPGGRTRQISLRPEQVPSVRRGLNNYQQVKTALAQICEINQQALRAERPSPKKRSQP